jgi:hypothetical protein
MTAPRGAHRDELFVLSLIGGGLIIILLSIIAGLFLAKGATGLPNWAENVLVSIATASALKLGDALAALVTLATGRQVENLGQQLATSTPMKLLPAPAEATDAAEQVADAAQERADQISGERA